MVLPVLLVLLVMMVMMMVMRMRMRQTDLRRTAWTGWATETVA